MVTTSYLRYDEIRESSFSVVGPCKNAQFLVSDIFSVSILCPEG